MKEIKPIDVPSMMQLRAPSTPASEGGDFSSCFQELMGATPDEAEPSAPAQALSVPDPKSADLNLFPQVSDSPVTPQSATDPLVEPEPQPVPAESVPELPVPIVNLPKAVPLPAVQGKDEPVEGLKVPEAADRAVTIEAAPAPVAPRPTVRLPREPNETKSKNTKEPAEVGDPANMVVPFVRPSEPGVPSAAAAKDSRPAPHASDPRQTPQLAVEPSEVKSITIQTESVSNQRIFIAPAPIEMGRDFSRHQSGGNDEKQSADSAPKTGTPQLAVFTDAPAKFDSHLVEAEPARPAAAHVVELPPQPPVLVAHKVSIDIGDADNRVTITLHERAGDVSVKFHSASEPLRAELQASVGSLVEAFHRENVSLANMDFSSGYAQTPSDRDSGQTSQQPGQQPRPRRILSAEKLTAAAAAATGITEAGVHFRA